ncbi:MAG: S9 family peptidase [Acidobacteriota bacterium]|nr:S9 family peptidase [Acidobacteriota bacterium]
MSPDRRKARTHDDEGSSGTPGGAAGAAPVERRPPVAREERHVTDVHGVELADPYHWLRRRDSPEVLAHLTAENRHAEAELRHTEPLRRLLYEEMLGRIQEDDSSVPVAQDGYFYYSRTEKDRPYRIHCRKRGSLEADEQVILDVNELADGHGFFSIAAIAVSPDHRLLAYSSDTTGGESHTVRVKDLASGELLGDVIEGASRSLVWAEDGRTLLYTRLDEAMRPYQVLRHGLGDPVEDDVVVFSEPDGRFYVSVGKTRSRRYLIVGSRSATTSEVWFGPADEPERTLRLFAERQPDVEYDVTHHEDSFLVRTNEDAREFRLLSTPVERIEREAWTEVLPHRPDVMLEAVDPFRDFIVRVERSGGLRRLVVDGLREGAHEIELPEPAYSLALAANPDYAASAYRFTYSSLVTPATVYDYHVAERRLDVMKRQAVLGGYDPSRFVTERVQAVAPDGVPVPISLVHARDLVRDGSHPCLLYGYGAYGISLEPGFSSMNLSLLERGFVYAIAHVRGGGELGEQWHDAGKLADKQNTFTDFIAAAEHLIERGYTASERLAIRGGSAGGLLIGAVINQRPELFGVALAHVPFVDVMNTMLDPDLPLTVTEYEEWGNPQDAQQFRTMLSYSPYDNVGPLAYPHLLVTAGLNDPRVQYWEPAKWVARLRARSAGERRLLLKTNMGAGHGGPSGRYGYLEERAFEFAFLLDTLELA